jgi:hypothetical protein
MIPIDSWQRLPPKAIWFGWLTSLGVALVLIGVQQPAHSDVPAQAVPADYAIACAMHGSGDINAVIPCDKFGEAQRCQHEADFPSNPTPPPAVLTVVNRSSEPIRFYWLDRSGTRTLYASLPPGGHVSQQSHIGAHWLLATREDQCIAIFDAATMTIGIF